MRSLLLGLVLVASVLALAASGTSAHAATSPYAPTITGQVIGFRLAGIEPDGDPLDQVALQTRLSPSGSAPRLNLFISSYLENFKPDTTPILPDLLHSTRTAQNLAGFLQGKALLTDNAGNVLYIGSFLAEAFKDNSNHVVMRLDGGGSAAGGTVSLKGSFLLRKNGTLQGSLTGRMNLPPAARRQILQNSAGKIGSKDVKRIINTVTVRPAPMMGRNTKGTSGAPLHTGYGKTPQTQPHQSTGGSSTHHLSTLTIVAGIGAVLSFLIAGGLFLYDRRRTNAQAEF